MSRATSILFRVLFVITLSIPVLNLQRSEPAHAYHHEAHVWIIDRAIDYLKQQPNGFAAKFPLDSFKSWLYFGSNYADHTEIYCHWYAPGIVDENYGCDTIHHYGWTSTIETNQGIDVAEPGGFAAPYYAQVLFEQSLNFWPGAPHPNLNDLPKMDGGLIETPVNVTDLGDTWVGGLPFCIEYVGLVLKTTLVPVSACPKWPYWAAQDTGGSVQNQQKVADEGLENALIYLGWTIHMIEDMTLPEHAKNDASKSHQIREDKINEWIANHDFDHLPILSGSYKYKPCNQCNQGDYWYPLFYFNIVPAANPFTVEEMAELARDWTIEVDNGNLIQPSSGSYKDTYGLIWTKSVAERNLDTAIKLVAAVMEAFFARVTRGPDSFEPNNATNKAAAINPGTHILLTLSDPQDHDWYTIHVPNDYSKLTVDLLYENADTVMAQMFTGTSGVGTSQKTVLGQSVTADGLMKGDYKLHVWLSDPVPQQYTMNITLSQATYVLPPDQYEENDSAPTAAEFFNGCDYTDDLNIDKPGDDDYYYVKVGEHESVSAEIWFVPGNSDLQLFIDGVPATLRVPTGPDEAKITSQSLCGPNNKATIRITGDPRSYELCVNIALDTQCGFVPPPPPPSAQFEFDSNEVLDNVVIIAFPEPGKWANVFIPHDIDRDGGGNVPLGTATLILQAELAFTGATHYVVFATTEDETQFVISSNSLEQLNDICTLTPTCATFNELFPEFSSYGGINGLLTDLVDGELDQGIYNPCLEDWEVAVSLGWDCTSVIRTAGEPDGILLTPFGTHSTLYAFPIIRGRLPEIWIPIGHVDATFIQNAGE